MKKMIIPLMFFLLVSFISAYPEIKIYNEEKFQPFETIVGNITGISSVLSSSDLKFYESRREVSFEKELINSEENYYFSVVFNREGNFSLKIENVKYYEGGILKALTLEKTFEVVKEKNSSQVLSIRPGVIITLQEFDLSLTNKGTEHINFSYGKKNKSSLDLGETEKIKIVPSEKFSLFEITSYKKFFVPIVYLKQAVENKTTEEKILSLRVVPKKIELSKFSEDTINFSLELFNFGELNLTQMIIKSDLDFLKATKLERLEGKNSMNVSFLGKVNQVGLFEENISISYLENGTKEELKIPVTIYVFQKNATEEEIQNSLSCFDVGGVGFCLEGEICNGKISDKVEGCCVGLCESPEKSSSNNFIVGIIILAFLGAIGFGIYKKFKDVKPKNKLIS